MQPHRTTITPANATACPWCGTNCTGAIRIAHVELDRGSESTIRRRWAA